MKEIYIQSLAISHLWFAITAHLHFPLISHDQIIQRRFRNLQVTSPGTYNGIPIRRKLINDTSSNLGDVIEVSELFQGYGTHYVDLWVGTPPQRQTVIVDTGSGVTAFPCKGCQDCGSDYHASAFFDESMSSTFQKMNCDSCDGGTCRNKGNSGEYCSLSVSYQEGSMWAAYEAKDITYLGGIHSGPLKVKEEGEKLMGLIHGEDPNDAPDYSFEMTFGCQNKITGLFKTQLADGIMGMCLRSSSIFQQMYNQGIIKKQSFSLCFFRAEDAAKDGTIAGALTMGGTDPKLHISPMIYAKGFSTKGVMHGVNIRAVYLMKSDHYTAAEATQQNTKKVDVSYDLLNQGSIIVDSGTTDTYFNRQLSTSFQDSFQKIAGFAYIADGMSLNDDQIDKLPTILIQLVGVSSNELGSVGIAEPLDSSNPRDILIAIPPSHYIEFDPDSELYVGRLFFTESYGSVLGANFIRGHDVYFDIPENSRIGFAPSSCDYLSLSGQNIPNDTVNDDQTYATEDVSKTTSEGSDKSSFDFHQFAIYVVGISVSGFIFISVLKKFKSRKYAGIGADDNEHLGDLHFQTEIQLAEIS